VAEKLSHHTNESSVSTQNSKENMDHLDMGFQILYYLKILVSGKAHPELAFLFHAYSGVQN
jgi:hypothetical protein